MKSTLRIIINRSFNDKNTRCSSKENRSKLPAWAIMGGKSTPRILGINPIKGLNFRSNFEGHSLSVNSLYSQQETASDKVIGVVSFVCFLVLLAFAMGV
jgi:hypothetical protein